LSDRAVLPDGPGRYRLWLDVAYSLRLRVGALGEIEFPPGRYAYAGSAMRGVRARVSRHLRRDGPLRWHVDYLLRYARVALVEVFPAADWTECEVNAQSLSVIGARIAVRGFGAGDCRCAAHLVWTPPGTPVPPADATALPSGTSVRSRLLRPDDGAMLASYFEGLSERTRALYGPHSLDRATAQEVCATLDPADTLRCVGLVNEGGRERIISYLLVKLGMWESDGRRYAALGIRLDPSECGALAPSVADDYQNQGVASAMMPHLLAMARSVGVRRLVLWGGVFADNHLAQGFYRKWGFARVGEFGTSVLSYDMMAMIGRR